MGDGDRQWWRWPRCWRRVRGDHRLCLRELSWTDCQTREEVEEGRSRSERAPLMAAEERLHLLCHGVISFTEPDGQGFMTLARIVEGLRPMACGL